MIKEAILNRFPIRQSEWDRFRDGKRWFLAVVEDDGFRLPLCLDVGSGARPFPYAISKFMNPKGALGEFIGLAKYTERGARML